MTKRSVTAAVAALVSLGMSSVSFAQCDDSAPELASNVQVNGNTCAGVVGLNLGGAILAHPTLVYRFDFSDQDGDAPEPDLIQIVGAEREFAIGTSCNTPPIGGGAPGVDFDLDAAGLTEGGRYYVFVTSDTGLPVTDPPRCGDFTLDPDTLPVELQSFSID